MSKPGPASLVDSRLRISSRAPLTSLIHAQALPGVGLFDEAVDGADLAAEGEGEDGDGDDGSAAERYGERGARVLGDEARLQCAPRGARLHITPRSPITRPRNSVGTSRLSRVLEAVWKTA